MNEVKNSAESATSSAASELDDGMQHSSNGMQNDKLLTDKEAEIETLSSLSGDLEKKASPIRISRRNHGHSSINFHELNSTFFDLQLEDLQQLALNPKSILSEILGMAAAKAKGNEKSPASVVMSSSRLGTANSSGDFDSPTVSTAHTSGAAAGVTHLGVVGRGVKRVSMSTASAESSPMKKPMPDPSSDKGDGSVC